jgi:hypothetical protein
MQLLLNRLPGFTYLRCGATWRSGYATVCKTVYSGSIPDVASTKSKPYEGGNWDSKFESVFRQCPMPAVFRRQGEAADMKQEHDADEGRALSSISVRLRVSIARYGRGPIRCSRPGEGSARSR